MERNSKYVYWVVSQVVRDHVKDKILDPKLTNQSSSEHGMEDVAFLID